MNLQQHAADVLKNDQADFVFLHLPVPHSPNIWSRVNEIIRRDAGARTWTTWRWPIERWGVLWRCCRVAAVEGYDGDCAGRPLLADLAMGLSAGLDGRR